DDPDLAAGPDAEDIGAAAALEGDFGITGHVVGLAQQTHDPALHAQGRCRLAAINDGPEFSHGAARAPAYCRVARAMAWWAGRRLRPTDQPAAGAGRRGRSSGCPDVRRRSPAWAARGRTPRS